ncbi:SusD/RagB family nutrient-binding outer membrane lipoprotein [Chitinophagaceae bacterium LWZ2-11]
MRQHLRKYIIKGMVSLSLIVLLISCKKSYFYPGINNDPSQLQNPVPSNLLPGIIASSGYEWGGDASRFTANFMQQVTGAANQSVLANMYNVSADDVDNMWTAGLYGGIMNNANKLMILGDSLKQYHYSAIGRILMANALGLTTDMWGDVPYTKAFLGIANTQPSYDTQQEIYVILDSLLTKAITDLSNADGSPFQPGTDDIMFGGNLKMWVKFAHSLRAKFFLHLAKQDNSNYAKALGEIATGFASGEAAGAPFVGGASASAQAPWYQFNTQRGDIAFTGFIYDTLANSNDPRAAIYSDGQGNLGPVVNNPLDASNGIGSNVSYPGYSNSTSYFMTYEELKFIQAECYLQTGDNTNAAAAYNAGVAASLQRMVGDISYLANVQRTAATITLADIIQQKYIANFLNPEVWTDWRRTGYPVLQAPAGSVLGGQLPRSLLYPSSEINYNANAPKNTSMLRRVWWDK